ncbi:cytochrome P450 family protein [Saccharopolyspora sp. CA-218241]|uniref:cytochrome P450 family protein n=1 Tax=Saccharopolyspora sp. CA-218241 TaxID=3240027 RepID=UPI003D996A56
MTATDPRPPDPLVPEPEVDADFVQHLHERYAEIRERTPVQRMMTRGGLPIWSITRYSDVRAALADPSLSKDVAGADRVIRAKLPVQDDDGGHPFTDSLAAHMLNMDPPDHTRVRKLVVKAFTPRRVEALRPRIEELTAELLDAMAGESTVDLLDAYAFPLPIRVICELLGIDESRRDDFRAWTNALLDDTDHEATMAAANAMSAYLVDLIERKRAEPGEDLLSGLIEATDEGDRLTRDELISMVFLLLIAGHETTVNLIGNAVLALLHHPDQWAALRADPELAAAAVEEALRFDAPVMHGTLRHTTRPVSYGGVEIPAGEAVWVGLSSANRDPERYPEPDRFDLGRDAQGHLAFGHGIHFCLGAQLARLEGRIALRRLVERFPDLRAAEPLDELGFRFSTLIHGLRRFPVHLG